MSCDYVGRPIGDIDPQTVDECLAQLLGYKSG